ncbi:putative C-14 sterol reductase [Trypanosoma rangeli]|uniref:Putative C-14 sterol reductase n=1 Tax=Trypanosoma rangeli TaxID=5698 RepID=A0A3R7KQ16_TRYRA|nr:putative C-14 sterol reductase [Trypanosoma rangeli]RNE99122.1 putative C-14 sterol reductase [Trypanosoma rangeli]|eukprot:RNE99122.1 putative C-14 sterol reductase [Trypanosoma rangeli]
MSSETVENKKQEFPFLLKKWFAFIDHLNEDCLGGPKVIKVAHVINMQKGGSLLICLLMMHKTGNYSATATTYTALHGGYGLCWLLKELVFPDPKWQKKITCGSAIAIFLSVLGPYWYIAYNAIVGHAEHSNMSLCAAIIVYSIGLFLMLGSDCQKYFVLKKEKTLITDGFFSRIRHPNYLGEMIIYGSFAFVSKDIRSFGVLAWVWVGLFAPFILRKERSMSRYRDWQAYTLRSGLLWPCLFVGKERSATC